MIIIHAVNDSQYPTLAPPLLHLHGERRANPRPARAGRTRRKTVMLRWALIFLIVALIAAVFGFGGIAAGAAGIAKILFVLFLIVFVISLIMGLVRRA